MIIWVANAFLLLAYVLLGRRWTRSGWTVSLIGNLLWWYPTFTARQWPFFSLSVVFACLAAYNLWKAVKYADEPSVRTA